MSQDTTNSFLDRTLLRARVAWSRMAGGEYDEAAASLRPGLPDDDRQQLRNQMQACLESRGGEVSARAKAAALGRVYLALDAQGRETFLRELATSFDVDHDAVRKTAAKLDTSTHVEDIEQQLRQDLEPPRLKLLTRFNALPEGVKFLVDMRANLLPLKSNDASLKALDRDIRGLLTQWFDVDFLELQRITWDGSSAALLEKLIAYEAVHAIQSWTDLKNRLDSDRRCFAFFHPRMPDEPLIFVEVALVNGMASSVQDLLNEDAPVLDPADANTAIFYSISNAQKGLAGISFGNFLIKHVVQELSAEFPGIKTFATLSPVPGFMAWLDQAISEGESDLLTSADHRTLNALSSSHRGAKGTLKDLLASPDWAHDKTVESALREPLMRLCARYLSQAKSNHGTALDPVAHFHLTNGARMERLNWMGDRADSGITQSAGMMINYLYKEGRIEGNHEAYKSDGAIATSSSLRSLARS
jgi:malonyl-CoA decarboxylase